MWRQNHGNKEGCKEVLKQEVFGQEVRFEEVVQQELKPQVSVEEEHEPEIRIEEEFQPQVQSERRQGRQARNARDETWQAAQWPQREKGNEPEAGNRYRTLRSASRRQKGSAEEEITGSAA
jgi:hypothetical protein